MDLKLELALEGNLEHYAEESVKAFLTALKFSVLGEVDDIQRLLREEVVNAGLGQGLANAWRADVHPAGMRLARNPGAFIYSKAAHIIEAFTKGETIHAQSGLMAVPIEGSPADELRIRPGQKLTEEVTRRFGPLRVVTMKTGLRMLVARGRVNTAGSFRPLAQRTHKTGTRFTPLNQKNQADIPMFWLVRDVRLEKRLSWPEIAAAREPVFARNVEARVAQRLGDVRIDGRPVRLL